MPAKRRAQPLLPLSICILAALTVAAAVEVDYDERQDFSVYRSYAWKAGTPARRSAAQARIVAAVDRELQARGLTVDDSAPDLWVVTHVLVDRQSLEQLSDERYFGFVAGIREADAYDLGAGTLVVDLVDVASERVVWRAVASRTVKGPAKKILPKIDEMVRQMFRRYPTPAR